MDRSGYPTRKLRLEDEHGERKACGTPAECVEMVWPLTLRAWEFVTWNQPEGEGDESRLRRDVGCDILTRIAGVEFEEAWGERLEIIIQGRMIPALGKRALICNKQQTRRPKDLGDVETFMNE